MIAAMSDRPRRTLDRPRIALIGCVTLVAILAVGWVIFWILPGSLAPDQSAGFGPQSEAKARSDVRTAALQFLGGCVLAVGAVFTAWSVDLTRQRDEEQRRANDERIRVDREGQITDRFTQAVDQLGHNARQVRVGGVYALERIARDSEYDRGAILEVLTAYLRVSSPRTSSAPTHDHPNEMPTAPDEVQAVVRVVLSLLREAGVGPITLNGLNLKALRLDPGTDLRGVSLARSCLAYAQLQGADLSGGDLSGADLDSADLTGANLQGAELFGATLQFAKLTGTDLRGAMLSGTRLKGAWLDGAALDGARFDYFFGTTRLGLSEYVPSDFGDPGEISGANLTGAIYDDDTRWPNVPSFDLSRLGVWHRSEAAPKSAGSG